MIRYILFLILCLELVANAAKIYNTRNYDNSKKLSKVNYDEKENESEENSLHMEDVVLRHGKIVGGLSTDIRFVPYQVSFQVNGKHLCGGSVIHPKLVLTAAHCILYHPEGSTYTVRGGSNYHSKEGEVRAIIKITVNPNYNTFDNSYDAALLELDKPFSSDGLIMPVPLAENEPKNGDEILISGWGSMDEKYKLSEALQAVSVPIFPSGECKNIYEKIHPITDSMFCAGDAEGGKDSCQGDSGGPAVLNDELVGIVSWGKGCGRKGMPGIYTNVALIRSWVNTELNKINIK